MTDEPAQASGPMSDPPRPVSETGSVMAPAAERARIEPSTPSRKIDLLPVLYLVGFVALAGTLFYLWENPPESHLAPQEASRVDTLETQLATLRSDIAALQQQKPPTPPPAPTQAAFDALQRKVGALETKPAVAPEQLAQLSQRVQTVEQAAGRPSQDVTQDLQALTQRTDALEKRPQVDPAAITAQVDSKIASSVDAKVGPIGTQVQQLASRVDEAGKLGPRIDQLQTKLDDLDKQQKQTADQLKAASQRILVASKLQGAAAALASGQKLGEIPGAPPALARFASEAPPTEASLRETFDRYAAAAQKANQPSIDENQDFAARLWSRAQQTVTVRQGDKVLVGDPISGVLAHAHEQLDNGSLGGAVETLKQLPASAAQAMQPWVEKAQALVQARAALAAMAAG